MNRDERKALMISRFVELDSGMNTGLEIEHLVMFAETALHVIDNMSGDSRTNERP